MAGRIREEDVEAVKERAAIEDVVRDHVTLTRAGTGRLKGLCPFHDEKTASFTVRPAAGRWHCFGCNEGGDVISFLMKVDHVTFVEAVEALAGRFGVHLQYEEGAAPEPGAHGRRRRLMEAHRVAEEFYHDGLLRLPDARAGRDFLRARGFDSAAAAHFGVGYAPRTGTALVAHLRDKGFTEDDLVLAGLIGRSERGPYDRFRGRLVWPIRDITGATVGFGARRLFDDDRVGAKYLNTAESPIYKKTTVLYGLDLAKKAIATSRRAVVVEGYTDVMAAHLAGVESAVATCGTAFGPDHVGTLRRILRDDSGANPARTVFTFDGDAAGQKAAMRAFEFDQKWASQSYVAVADGGQDPCDLRLSSGDAAVRLLIEGAAPMFEFAVRTTLAAFDLGTAEGRVAGMRAVAPIIAGIRDQALRPEYTRTVAGWIGVEVDQLHRIVAQVGRGPQAVDPRSRRRERDQAPEAEAASTLLPRPDLRDPDVDREHQLLQMLVQYPQSFSDDDAAVLAGTPFTDAAHRRVQHAVLGAWDDRGSVSARGWLETVEAGAGEEVGSLVSELAMAPLQALPDPRTGGPDQRYVADLLTRTREVALSRRIAETTGAMQRAEADDPGRVHTLAVELTGLQSELARLRMGVA
ncbi:DNA primase [Kineosphaera limosa]|uniref:DNA primase n=1 Tax=Kineosphaera limosa NBRC 100340 TaxID=1184609 RepID=K6WMV0_9MICO|nr:DNA primase [Kineosphaera limosa]NYE02972.1 DNA primase [Kineosphaera limosa]GAB95136.1 DNA primase [Kineosphaera limosa NBRC 100340]